MNSTGWFILGLILGWITKVPLLYKWYKELEQTEDYRNAILKKKYKEMFPDEKL